MTTRSPSGLVAKATKNQEPGTRNGFSLIEIIIALTILAVIAAAAIPSMRGVQKERLAREPIAALVRIAKEARLHAMSEQRPYQVVLHSGGFTATRYFDPYLTFADLSEFMTLTEAGLSDDPEAEADTAAAVSASASADSAPVASDSPGSVPPSVRLKPKSEWTDKYELPPNTTFNVQFWHDTEPTEIQGEVLKLWVFQPSGICEPIKLHLVRDSATFDVEFSALTVDIIKESSALN